MAEMPVLTIKIAYVWELFWRALVRWFELAVPAGTYLPGNAFLELLKTIFNPSPYFQAEASWYFPVY